MSIINQISEKQIAINDKVIDFPATVWAIEETPDLCIVILHPGYSMVNVFAYDKFGNQVWIIEKADFVMDGDGYCIVTDRGSKLVALSRGIHFFIDPKTGKITGSYNERGGGYSNKADRDAANEIANSSIVEVDNSSNFKRLWRKIAQYLN